MTTDPHQPQKESNVPDMFDTYPGEYSPRPAPASTTAPAQDYKDECSSRNERLCETEGVPTICCTCPDPPEPVRNCEACIQGYTKPCKNPLERCPYYEPGCMVPKLDNGEPNCPDECAFSEQQQAHDTVIARHAREQERKDFAEFLEEVAGSADFMESHEIIESLRFKAESLRSQQQGGAP